MYFLAGLTWLQCSWKVRTQADGLRVGRRVGTGPRTAQNSVSLHRCIHNWLQTWCMPAGTTILESVGTLQTAKIGIIMLFSKIDQVWDVRLHGARGSIWRGSGWEGHISISKIYFIFASFLLDQISMSYEVVHSSPRAKIRKKEKRKIVVRVG